MRRSVIAPKRVSNGIYFLAEQLFQSPGLCVTGVNGPFLGIYSDSCRRQNRCQQNCAYAAFLMSRLSTSAAIFCAVARNRCNPQPQHASSFTTAPCKWVSQLQMCPRKLCSDSHAGAEATTLHGKRVLWKHGHALTCIGSSSERDTTQSHCV